MTAINIRLTDRAVTVWTDGLLYDPDGIVLNVVRKVRRLGDWNAILTTTGLAAGGAHLERVLPEMATSFDDFLERKEDILPVAMEAIQPRISTSNNSRFAAFVAGWSERQRAPVALTYIDQEGTGRGLIGTTDEIICPSLSEEEKAMVVRSLAGAKRSVRELVVQVMEAQRRHRANPAYNNSGASFVGGHITETVVDEAGIRETIVHRWPQDEVGERIRPDPAPAVLAAGSNVVPMNRQQRRAAERSRRTVAA